MHLDRSNIIKQRSDLYFYSPRSVKIREIARIVFVHVVVKAGIVYRDILPFNFH